MSGSARFGLLRRWLRVENLEDRTTPTAVTVDSSSFATDRVLVTLADGADAATAVANLAASPLAAGVERLGFNIYQVNLRVGVSVGFAIPALDAIRGVAYAEADYAIGLNLTPNDPNYGSLWGMNNTGQSGGTVDADIDAPEAWDIARGTGQHIVAVIDTGVDYNHPDLAANMWRNPGETAGDGIDNDANGLVDDIYGADYANNDADPMDDNNHGTHCAGTIGGVGNNGVGVTGVAWTTRIMALKFLTASGSGSTSNAIRCIDYAISKGASILSNSWGGGGYSSTLEQAITRARNAGAIFVAAAGNNGANTDVSANYPSNYAVDNVVSVAAIDRNNNLASFSNYGATTVDLGAPGVSILSTTRNNTYSSFSGTSMATPHVAGAIAVFWDRNPTLTYTQVIQRLLGSVDQITSLSGRTVTGGKLNLLNLLNSTSPPTSPPPTSPPPTGDVTGARVTSAVFSGGTANTFNRVRVTFNEAMTAGSFTTADVVSLTAPGGVTLTPTGVTPVAGTNNQFDVTFAMQTTPGTYAVTVGPDILDVAGNAMDQNQNGVNGENPADRYSATARLYPGRQTFGVSGLSVPINDLSTSTVSIVVPATSVVNGFTITDLNVTLSLTHTYTADLIITLISPSGKAVTLFQRRGGSGDNLTGTTFNDEATTLIRNGSAPFSGSFRPDAALSGFDGLNPVGTWTLSVRDAGRLDVGTISAVSLDIATNPADSASGQAMGVADDPFTSGPVTVGGPGVAASFSTNSPTLLAPPTAINATNSTRVQTPTSGDVAVTVPAVAPTFNGMATFEPTATEWTGLASRPLWSGFRVG